jgi:hypothetical protein
VEENCGRTYKENGMTTAYLRKKPDGSWEGFVETAEAKQPFLQSFVDALMHTVVSYTAPAATKTSAAAAPELRVKADHPPNGRASVVVETALLGSSGEVVKKATMYASGPTKRRVLRPVSTSKSRTLRAPSRTNTPAE